MDSVNRKGKSSNGGLDFGGKEDTTRNWEHRGAGLRERGEIILKEHSGVS